MADVRLETVLLLFGAGVQVLLPLSRLCRLPGWLARVFILGAMAGALAVMVQAAMQHDLVVFFGQFAAVFIYTAVFKSSIPEREKLLCRNKEK